MYGLPGPPNTLEHLVKEPAARPLCSLAGSFTPESGLKKELQRYKKSAIIPQMVEYKEIRIKIEVGAHHILLQCCENQGYATISEFVKRAIQEKIAKECYHLIMTVEEIEAVIKEETKKP